MTDKEKIKEEIERRMNNLWYLIPEGEKVLKDDFTKDDANNLGKYTALENLLHFIDSLPEEHNEDLEEEIKNYFSGWCMRDSREQECFFQVAHHFAEWQKQKDDKHIGDLQWEAYLKGEQETKQQMMKDAVELYIVESLNPVGTENEKPHGFTALCYNAEYPGFYPVTGQTIKVIPIKKNNNEQDC